MTTIQRHPGRFSTEQLLGAIDQLDASELRPFVSRVVARAARRIAPSLPPKESDLLQRINRGLPADLDQRSRDLVAKRRSETLSPSEHEELLKLTDDIEKWQAERVGLLVKLAELRGMSLPDLMDDLGIEPPQNFTTCHSS